ncbi:Nudix hydrolase 6-like protein [Artemisia annua]|uniref:Nudix hydrolase 6-like protein n=1 Tax=Artemisia annua TaxID=35608 RepID=A0A2U1NTG9_ARTAN|nr:Nudix hydrolase 6-like protein [Artemisia annua]
MDLKSVIVVSNSIGPKAKNFTVSSFSIYKAACSLEAASLSSRNSQAITQAVAKYPYRYDVNATNTPISNNRIPFTENQRLLLDAFDDEYGGVIVNPEKLPVDSNLFASVLHSSISIWRTQGKKGIWLKLPLEKCDLVPIAVKEGFQYHHAEAGYVMMTYWIPDEPCMLPANASHQVGVGGFVLNDKNEVLVVQEKHCAPELVGLWKLPTGFILESEEIFTGAVREVKEETGIETEFLEVIAFRHAHNVAFEKSDLFFICMLRPVSTEIKIDDLEVQAAKWMPLIEFVEQPLIKGDRMFKKIMDMCIARIGKRYCGLSVHKVVSKFDNRLSSLYYNVVDSASIDCLNDSCDT